MRILALVTDAFGGGYGGIAKFNRDLLSALCSYPECVEVVAIPRIMPNTMEPLPAKLTYFTEGLNSKLKYISTVFKACRVNPKFDLIICGHIHLLPVANAVRLFGVRAPILLVLHGSDAWCPAQKWLAKYFVKKIDAFVSVSKTTEERFMKWAKLNNKVGFILPCCVDISNFGPAPKKTDLLNRYRLNGKTVLMTLGRLVTVDGEKGFDEVLELMPELAHTIPNLAYLIAGDGPDRKRLERKAESLGIQDRVIFTGFIQESEKADHYRLADAFVMPGRVEGFGIVYLEAMACGIPVVASKADGSREAVCNGEIGILVDPDNPEEIKTGILEALKRPKGIIPNGLDSFSFPNFKHRLHSIMDQIIHSDERVSFLLRDVSYK